jgi:hypothetical protein
MITEQQVVDSLTLLGSEAHIIASHLMVKGIKGQCEEASSCAIAAFLDQEFPDYEFSVEGDIKVCAPLNNFFGDIQHLFTVQVSEQVGTFIEEFDAGYYPSLIEHEIDCDGFAEVDGTMQCVCGYIFTSTVFGVGEARIKPEAQMTLEEVPVPVA